MGKKAAESGGGDGRLRELEERAALFEREAVSGAHLIAQLEATLRVNEQARRKLEALVVRQSEELKGRRQEAAELKRRLAAADKLLAESEAARKELSVKMQNVLECAEAVRREGIDAFEAARALDSRRAETSPRADPGDPV